MVDLFRAWLLERMDDAPLRVHPRHDMLDHAILALQLQTSLRSSIDDFRLCVRRSRLPLTALRSFEAAGRLLSFTGAARELCVSQAAISRQVRDLEVSLGRALFVRHHRAKNWPLRKDSSTVYATSCSARWSDYLAAESTSIP